MKPSAKPKILAYRGVEWTEEIDQAIGTASDSIIGRRLGQVPDDQMALEIGLSYQFVAEKRLELGLPAKRRSSLKWTDPIIQKMGKVSDAAIALELGCSTTLVQWKRNELCIAPFCCLSPKKAAWQQE